MDMAIHYGMNGMPTAFPLAWTGCVVVASDGNVLGRGFTRSLMSKDAVESAINEARSLYSDDQMHSATAYVTIEPTYSAEQPSRAAALLLSTGFSRVVFALEHPQPAYAGACIAALQKNGVSVDVSVQESLARMSLYPFLYTTKYRAPLVKMCVSTMAPVADAASGNASAKKVLHKRTESIGMPTVGIREDVKLALPHLVTRFRHHCAAAGAIVVDARKTGAPDLLEALVQAMAISHTSAAGRGESVLPSWIIILDPEAEMVFSERVRAVAAQGVVRLAWAKGDHQQAQENGAGQVQQSPFVGLELLSLPTVKSVSGSAKAGRMILWASLALLATERLQVAQVWIDDMLVTGRLIDELRKQQSVDVSVRWNQIDTPTSDTQQILSPQLQSIVSPAPQRGRSGSHAGLAGAGIPRLNNVSADPPAMTLDGLASSTYGSLPSYHNGTLTVQTIIPGSAPSTAPHLSDNKPIFFRTGDDHFGYLSNFYADPISIGGASFPTLEHYYQAQKFSDPAVQEEIRSASGPLEAKNLSRQYAEQVRSDWEEVKVDVMDAALRIKFTKPKLLGALLATKERLLVEYSDHDSFWGSDYSLLGRNYLGRLLMRLRGEFNGVVAAARLPCAFGEGFRIVAFAWSQHVAVVHGELDLSKPVLARLHSECVTGDVFGSQRCDCGPQLHSAMNLLRESGAGVLLYLRQEGRGIGISNKVRAYKLQEHGFDTIEANEILGFPADMRDFSEAAAMLRVLGVKQVRLITNNPDKRDHLVHYGIPVVDTVALPSPIHPGNEAYLLTKLTRMGHTIQTIGGGAGATAPAEGESNLSAGMAACQLQASPSFRSMQTKGAAAAKADAE